MVTLQGTVTVGLREAVLISGPLGHSLGVGPWPGAAQGKEPEPTAGGEAALSCYKTLSVKKKSVCMPYSFMDFGCVFVLI